MPMQQKQESHDEEISRLMDDETWMGAKKAVDFGFADGILWDQNDPDENTMNGIVRRNAHHLQ